MDHTRSHEWLRTLALVGLAALLLLTGLGRAGLLDPWEMNRTHIAQVVASPARVLVAGAPEAAQQADFQAAAQACCELHDTNDERTPSFENAVSAASAELRKSLYHVVVLFPDAGGTGAPTAETLAKRLTSMSEASPGTAFVVATSRFKDDAEALEAAGAQVKVVAPDQAGAELAAHRHAPWFRVQYRSGGKLFAAPVLDYWLEALSFRLLGFNELSARLPGALVALLLVLAVAALGASFTGRRRAGELAALVVATSPLFVFSGRAFAVPCTLPLFLTLAALPPLWSTRRALKATDLALFVAILLGGFLSAGLTFLVLVGATLGAWVLVGAGPRKAGAVYAGVTLALLGLGALAVFLPAGWTFLDHFRFMSHPFKGGLPALDRNFDYFIKVVGFGLLPWSALVPFALGHLVLRGGDDKSRDLLAALSALVPYVALSAMLPDFHHAFLAAFPLFALAVGLYLDRLFEDQELRGRFIGFVGFFISVILVLELKETPLPLFNSFLADPPLAPELGDFKLPYAVRVPGAVLLLPLLFGLSLIVFFGRGWSRSQSALALLRERRWFSLALAGAALLAVADAFTSVLLRINVTVMSGQAGMLAGPDQRFPFVVFGARGESVAWYLALAALALAFPLRVAWARLRGPAGGWSWTGFGVRVQAVLAAAAGALLLLALVGVAMQPGGGAALAGMTRSAAFVLWLGLVALLAGGWLAGAQRAFGPDSPFPWLAPLAQPQVAARVTVGAVLAGLFFLSSGAARGVAANGPLLWLGWLGAALAVLLIVVPLVSGSAWRYVIGLLLSLLLMGLHFVPFLVEAWLRMSAALYPQLPPTYARHLYLGSPDILFFLLLALLLAANYLAPRASHLLEVARRPRVLCGALAPLLLGVLLGALLSGGALTAHDQAFGRLLGRVVLGLAGVVTATLLLNYFAVVPAWALRLYRLPITRAALAALAVLLVLAGGLTGKDALLMAAAGPAVLTVLSWVLDAKPLAELPGRLEEPAPFAAVAGLLALCLAFAWGHGLLDQLAAQFSQKHILDTYRTLEHREDLGTNLFKHGAFSKAEGEDYNFYTNAIPEIRDRAKVLKALAAAEDLPVKLTYSRPTGRPENVVLQGWDPANDVNQDGRRDWGADVGIASFGTQGSLEDSSRAWAPGQWKGSLLLDSGGKSFTVSDNTPTRLSLDGTPNFLAYNPLFNAYALDASAAVNHKATAMAPPTYYFLFPKRGFADINHEYRQANRGATIPVLDDRSDFFVLAANRVPGGAADHNWIARSVLNEETFKKDSRIRPGYAKFEDFIEFIGFRMGSESVTRGSRAEINMYFRVIGETRTSYKLFMHVDRPGSGNRINGDHWPLNLIRETETANQCEGCFKTTQWMKGDVYMDRFELEVPIGTPSGTQEVWVGLYNPTDEKRLKVVDNDKDKTAHDGGNRIKAGTFIVP
jgi:hypothetical protein